jgi:hypothetical protein
MKTMTPIPIASDSLNSSPPPEVERYQRTQTGGIHEVTVEPVHYANAAK